MAFGRSKEWQGHFLRHIGERKFNDLERRLFLLHAGEVNEVVGKACEPLRLVANVGEPLIFSALHLCQLHIGADDGHGRFQFVAGIGDELLLLFIALGNRTDNTVGQNQQQHQHRQQAQHGQCHAGQQGRAEGGQAPSAVQENDAGVPFLLQYQIAVIVQESGGSAGFDR